jgi:hypothetical protein
MERKFKPLALNELLLQENNMHSRCIPSTIKLRNYPLEYRKERTNASEHSITDKGNCIKINQ